MGLVFPYVHIAHKCGWTGAARGVRDEQHYSGQCTSEQLVDYLTEITNIIIVNE